MTSGELTAPGERPRFLATSVGLVAGKVVSLGVGFLFWLLAAASADVGDVGLAAGAVSLMMLGTQVAIAGAGSAFILTRAAHGDRVTRLLDTAVTVVLLASAAAAAVALVAVAVALDDLARVARDPVFAVLFVLMTAFGSVGILLDQVSVAFQRGEQVLVKNVVGGLVTAGPLLLGPLAGWRFGATSLFALWVVGGATALCTASVQLHRVLGGYRFRPSLERSLVRTLLTKGLPNHALTLVERAPNLLLPVVVTEVLSPELNAYWYIAWMMAWAVLVIPVSIGITLLAQVSSADARLRDDVLRAGRVGVLLGVPAAVAVAVAAGPFLDLLGDDYRVEGAGPLRVLLLALPAVLLLQLYYSVCRSRGRLREALATGLLTAVGALAFTAAVARDRGLVGMAAAWVAVQVVAGAWAAVRLSVLVPRGASTVDATSVHGLPSVEPLSAVGGQPAPASPTMGA